MVPGVIDIAYTCLIKRSLLENADKFKTVSRIGSQVMSTKYDIPDEWSYNNLEA